MASVEKDYFETRVSGTELEGPWRVMQISKNDTDMWVALVKTDSNTKITWFRKRQEFQVGDEVQVFRSLTKSTFFVAIKKE